MNITPLLQRCIISENLFAVEIIILVYLIWGKFTNLQIENGSPSALTFFPLILLPDAYRLTCLLPLICILQSNQFVWPW
jgi:hypothetical protein